MQAKQRLNDILVTNVLLEENQSQALQFSAIFRNISHELGLDPSGIHYQCQTSETPELAQVLNFAHVVRVGIEFQLDQRISEFVRYPSGEFEILTENHLQAPKLTSIEVIEVSGVAPGIVNDLQPVQSLVPVEQLARSSPVFDCADKLKPSVSRLLPAIQSSLFRCRLPACSRFSLGQHSTIRLIVPMLNLMLQGRVKEISSK